MDYLSLKAAVSEASEKLSGKRISDCWQAHADEIVLLTGRGPALLLSIQARSPGLYLANSGDISHRLPSPYTDLLRARIKGTTLSSILILEPGERIVRLAFESTWPARSGTPLTILLEAMGRHSNLMILEEERIVQPLRPVPKSKSPARPIIAGELYKNPPSRPGIPVEKIMTADLMQIPAPGSPEAPGALMSTVMGLSPYTASQALLRAIRDESDEYGPDLALIIAEMAAASTGRAGYLLRTETGTHLSPFEPLARSMNSTVEKFCPFSSAATAWRKSREPHQEKGLDHSVNFLADLKAREDHILSALDQINKEEERCLTHTEIRVMAEALLISASSIGQIAGSGAGSIVLPDPYDPTLELTVPLDPSKNPQENANDLFIRARRLKRGLAETSGRRSQLEQDLAAIRHAAKAMTDREDSEPARQILGTAATAPGKKRQVSAAAYAGPGRRHIVDGFTILVGKSSTDNEKVTFKAAGPNDLWLHARDFPGSHVVILTEKKQVPDKVLYAAAALAAKGSGAKNDTAPEIMVTERKWVRKLKGGKPGMVTVERFRTIRPRIQEPESRSRKK